MPLNWMLTIRVPTNLCDAQGKRYAHNVTRVLFQALRRRGSPSIAVTIYERKKNKQELHAHILVHIPSRCTDLIDKRLDPPALHVRRTDDRAVTYVTKERWARGIAPRDELEGMMAAQLIAAHNAAMECYRRGMIREQTFEGRRENLNQANKLSRTFATLLEALHRHRGKAHQKVVVEHVHVHSGGQAIVGAVSGPGGGDQTRS